MDTKSLAKIGLRLLALYMIGVGITLVPMYAQIVYEAMQADSFTGDRNTYLTGICSMFVMGAVLWFLAPYIAKWTVGKSESAAAPASVDAAALQAAAFSVLGVYFFVAYLPAFIGLVIESIGYAADSKVPLASGQYLVLRNQLASTLLRALFGLALILGSGFFTQLLRRFREFGLAPSSRE